MFKEAVQKFSILAINILGANLTKTLLALKQPYALPLGSQGVFQIKYS